MDNWKNQIIIGDCKDVLQDLYEKYGEFVDTITIDPPFFSGQKYDVVWDNGAELAAYDDTGMYTTEYEVDEKALEAAVSSAMDTFESGLKGTIDGIDIPKAKIIATMREYYEKEKRKEIQGLISRGGMDNYLAFMRTRIAACHRVLKPTGTMFLHCNHAANHHLRLLMDEIFGAKNFRNEIIWHYFMGGKAKTQFARKHDTIFLYTKSNSWTFNSMRHKRRLDFKPSLVDDSKNAESGRDEFGYYSVVTMDDVWDMKGVFNMSKEYLGYPTQKPEILLERIIKASSNEGDIILDAFLGGGPAIVVAERLKRRWIGIDISKRAGLMTIRNLDRYEIPRDHYTVNFNIIEESAIMNRMAELVRLPWNEMEELIRKILGFKWTPNCKVYGIDGQHTEDEHYFLEVKQWKSNVGQQVVEKLYGKMQRRNGTKGIIVADGFTKGALKAERDFQEKGINITLKEIESFVREGLI